MTVRKALITTSRLLLALLMMCLSVITAVHAQDAADQIRKLKSAFLFNFLRYSEIPSEDTVHLHLCLYGEEAKTIGKYLEEIKGTTIGGKVLVIKPLSTLTSISDCEVIYYENNRSLRIDTKALVVSSEPALATIQFTTVHDTLQFKVDLDDAKTKGIYLSSQLLRVAYKVD